MRPAEQQRMRRFRDAALEPMSARGPKLTPTSRGAMSAFGEKRTLPNCSSSTAIYEYAR
jgi:hypothetical protein